MLKILLLSDMHVADGRPMLSYRSAEKYLKKISKNTDYDVVVDAGDDSGGFDGYKGKRWISKLLRRYFPKAMIIDVLGNHDRWAAGNVIQSIDSWESVRVRPSQAQYDNNIKIIKESLQEASVHSLDFDGLRLIEKDNTRYFFIGSGGWYTVPNPPTNDKKYLPIGLENFAILQEQENNIQRQLDELERLNYNAEKGDKLVFVSHFGLAPQGGIDWKGSFELFGWNNPNLMLLLKKDFNCLYFLCGHSHKKSVGPLIYNAGSDYGRPDFVEIIIP
jgi:predicted phosphodiesterase